MGCQVWNYQQIAVNVDQTGLYTFFSFYHNAACNRQRTVKPCGIDHATVTLGVELNVFAFDRLLRIVFNLECWGITVACHNVERFEIFGWNLECDNRRKVAGYKVFSALFDLPFFVFAKFLKTFFFQFAFTLSITWKQLGEFSIKSNNS